MARCYLCDNDYDKTFEILMDGRKYTFDSFECAIEALAPRCWQCECRIIGHGLESEGQMFCCSNCATTHGVNGLRDRTDNEQHSSVK